jgi:hypothetical protein
MQFPRVCFGCGRPDRGIHDVGALNQAFKACDDCLKKYGPRVLKHEADRLLAEVYGPKPRTKTELPLEPGFCLYCGHRTIARADGAFPMWHAECDAPRGALIDASANRDKPPAESSEQ